MTYQLDARTWSSRPQPSRLQQLLEVRHKIWHLSMVGINTLDLFFWHSSNNFKSSQEHVKAWAIASLSAFFAKSYKNFAMSNYNHSLEAFVFTIAAIMSVIWRRFESYQQGPPIWARGGMLGSTNLQASSRIGSFRLSEATMVGTALTCHNMIQNIQNR